MPPRPHPLVLASLAFGCAVVMALVLPHHAAGAVGLAMARARARDRRFPRLSHARRSRAGSVAASTCRRALEQWCAPRVRGRVTFTGALPHRGLAVTVRCGRLMATYLGLGYLATHARSRVGRGDAARHARRDRPAAPQRASRLRSPGLRRSPAPPRRRRSPPFRTWRPRRASSVRHRLPPTRPAPRPIAPATPPAPGSASAPRRLPWLAYPALALVACALPLGGLLRHRRRRSGAPAADALGARS
jgi:hypothetical protein